MKREASRSIVQENTKVGDAAVDGLLAGMAAGVVMAVYLIGASLLGGEGLAVLNRFDPSGASPMVGALMHLAVSGVYGATFGIIANRLRRFNVPAWLSGVIFGLALFVLAVSVILPNSRSALAGMPVLDFGIAHVVYGLVIGIVISRNAKS